MAEPADQDRQIQKLAKEVVVLRSDMNAKQAEYESALDRLRADMAKRDIDMVKRDKDNQRWVIGFGIAQIAITISVFGAGIAFLALIEIPAVP